MTLKKPHTSNWKIATLNISKFMDSWNRIKCITTNCDIHTQELVVFWQLEQVLFSNERIFPLHRHANCQNSWLPDNPYSVREHTEYPKKIMCTACSHWYPFRWWQFKSKQLLSNATKTMSFQQDGAPPRYLINVRQRTIISYRWLEKR